MDGAKTLQPAKPSNIQWDWKITGAQLKRKKTTKKNIHLDDVSKLDGAGTTVDGWNPAHLACIKPVHNGILYIYTESQPSTVWWGGAQVAISFRCLPPLISGNPSEQKPLRSKNSWSRIPPLSMKEKKNASANKRQEMHFFWANDYISPTWKILKYQQNSLHKLHLGQKIRHLTSVTTIFSRRFRYPPL